MLSVAGDVQVLEAHPCDDHRCFGPPKEISAAGHGWTEVNIQPHRESRGSHRSTFIYQGCQRLVQFFAGRFVKQSVLKSFWIVFIIYISIWFPIYPFSGMSSAVKKPILSL